MRAQRPAGAAPCVAATAESLPFDDQSFDAAMAFAPFITGRTRSPACARCGASLAAWWCSCSTPATAAASRFWLTRDYLPEVAAFSRAVLASLPELAGAIGARMEPVPIPWDCADGFFEAYWRRPEAYLDEHVRRGISVWAASGRTPSRGRCAASATTSPLVGGPNATATSSTSTRQSSASPADRLTSEPGSLFEPGARVCSAARSARNAGTWFTSRTRFRGCGRCVSSNSN